MGAAVANRRILERRLRAQLLTGPPAREPGDVARHLLATQAQDGRGARLAIRSRTAPGRLAAADVDAALASGELIVSWFNRGTLHLIAAEDYGLLQLLTTPQLATACRRRLRQEGVGEAMAERGIEIVRAALAEVGPLTGPELRERLEAREIRTDGQALVHLLFAATLAGVCVRGPMRGARQAFVLIEDWLDPEARHLPDGDAARAELARRFLAARGPASERDLAWWAGIPVTHARRALAAISSELDEGVGELAGQRLVRLAGAPRAAGVPAPRLLGSFEELLTSWRSRELIVGEAGPKILVGGLFKPFALVDGAAAATWKLRAGRIELEPFGRLSRADREALEADAEDVIRFLDP